jgi:hypothetical protein
MLLATSSTRTLTPAQMWATQPHLRTVVSFLARNIAQLGLHSFERDRRGPEAGPHVAVRATMRRPNATRRPRPGLRPGRRPRAVRPRLLADVPDATSPSGWTFRRSPPWVTPIRGTPSARSRTRSSPLRASRSRFGRSDPRVHGLPPVEPAQGFADDRVAEGDAAGADRGVEVPQPGLEARRPGLGGHPAPQGRPAVVA